MFEKLRNELRRKGNKKKAEALQRFFKTGKGEYAERDIFLGVTVPQSRKIAQKFANLDFKSIQTLLKSKIHEERLIAFLILIHNFKKGSDPEKKKIFDFYLSNTKFINNWDLVDLSAPKIVGRYLSDQDPVNRSPLIKLAKSKSIWERRIAVLATFTFIKNNEFEIPLKIAERLLNDKHDLIHKAVGWMLREVGKKDIEVEEKFLRKYYKKMPRTMLRYAIEKFQKNKRLGYLSLKY